MFKICHKFTVYIHKKKLTVKGVTVSKLFLLLSSNAIVGGLRNTYFSLHKCLKMLLPVIAFTLESLKDAQMHDIFKKNFIPRFI